MRITCITFALIVCFCASLLAEGKGNDLMLQAEKSVEQKDLSGARNLYIQAYEAFSAEGEYAPAIDCGTKAVSLLYRENNYQDAFTLCREMTQFLLTQEQKAQTVFYDQRFLLTKERLQMYIKLRNAEQAGLQMGTLENLASQSGNEQLGVDLLYIKAIYYYTFGQTDRGDAEFTALEEKLKAGKQYDKVSDCYKELIAIARTSGDAAMMERIYERYIVWTDSVKALNAHSELAELQQKYGECQDAIAEKDSSLSGKRYVIAGLSTLAIILVAALVGVVFLLLRFIMLNKNLKDIIRTTNEHGEQQTRFIQSISEQMKPTLDALDVSTDDLHGIPPLQKASIKMRIEALRQFGVDLQELSTLEGSLMEGYEVQSFNVQKFCNKVMDKVRDKVHPEVELAVDALSLEVKTNPEQLERILLHLLENAARYTTSGKIRLEFKRKGAHLCHIIVTDSGTGIPDEEKENLFKPFGKVRDLAEGDGLGLPICALIATKLGGNLSLDPDYKKGCRFILVLKI